MLGTAQLQEEEVSRDPNLRLDRHLEDVVEAEAGGKRQLQWIFRLWGLLEEEEEVWEFLLLSVHQAPVWDPQ